MQRSWLTPLPRLLVDTHLRRRMGENGKRKWKENVLLALSQKKHSTFIIELSKELLAVTSGSRGGTD